MEKAKGLPLELHIIVTILIAILVVLMAIFIKQIIIPNNVIPNNVDYTFNCQSCVENDEVDTCYPRILNGAGECISGCICNAYIPDKITEKEKLSSESLERIKKCELECLFGKAVTSPSRPIKGMMNFCVLSCWNEHQEDYDNL